MAFKLKWSAHSLDLDQRTHVMGVINVTPDSFSDGGEFYNHETALEHGIAMAEDGADNRYYPLLCQRLHPLFGSE